MIEQAVVDPRVRRTRQLLHQAFTSLLGEKGFESITVQDIAERSTVNRATFYDHYTDKFALLEDMIAEEFRATFRRRMEGVTGACPVAIRQLILTVCDFLGDLASRCQKHQRQFAPTVESQIKRLVRDYLLEGARISAQRENRPLGPDVEIGATMASWAICGACLDWSRTKKISDEAFASLILPSVLATMSVSGSASAS
jgi:AcrR family transcriptional regulator